MVQFFSSKPRRLLSLGCALLLSAVSLLGESDTELKVKAAYIYNFAKFVTWQASALPAVNQPVTLCTLGAPSFTAALQDTLKTKMVDGHSLVVRQLDPLADVGGCAILYVAPSAVGRLSKLIPSGKSSNILTIGEESSLRRAAACEAIITLFAEDNRIRFAINNRAAEKAGIVVSSKLLSLAASVGR